MNQCLDCGRTISLTALRCGSHAKRHDWQQGRYAHVKPYKGGSQRKPRDEAMTRFTVLVMAVCAVEAALTLYITGALRPL